MSSEITTGERTFALTLRLTNRAARSVVQLLSDAAGDQLLEDRDLREEALLLLHELFGDGSGGVYDFKLQNGGQGREGDGLVNLWLAPNGEGTENAAVLRRLKDWPLVLMGTSQPRRYGEEGTDFLVIDLVALPPWSVATVPDALSGKVAFDWGGRFASGVPAEAHASLRRMPVHRLQRDRVRLLLEDWNRFLRVRRRIAEAARFSVDYVGYRLDEAGRRARFQVVLPDAEDGGADGFDLHKVRQAKGEDLHLDLTPEDERVARALAEARGEPHAARDGPGEVLGEIQQLQGRWLEVRLDHQIAAQIRAGRRDLPKKGRLQYRAIGELAQVRRLRWGLESLLRGRASNPRLGEFLFDPNEAALSLEAEAETLAPDDLLQPHLNAGQLRAVAGALSAPDLYLIQGPPGTGKTTVIAEICYQVAKRGGRTMVASQANLAVDNAMSKLVHDPLIRALRRGRAESVEEEGQPYLEDYVIGTWLDKIGADCQGDLDARIARAQTLAGLLAVRPALEAFEAARVRYGVESREKRAQVAAETQAQAAQRERCDATAARVDALQAVASILADLIVDDSGDVVGEIPATVPGVDPSPEGADASAEGEAPSSLNLIAEEDVRPLHTLARALAPWIGEAQPHGPGAGATAVSAQGADGGDAVDPTPAAPDAGVDFILDYVRRRRVARESATRVRAWCAELGPKIEALDLLCRSWHEIQATAAPLLERQRARLAVPRARQARISELEGALAQQEADLAALQVLLGEMNQIHRGLASWLLRRATVDREVDAVPPAFQSPDRRALWAAALGEQRLPTLRGIAAKARHNRDVAEALGRMVAQIRRCVGRLRPEITPRALSVAARQPPDWRATTLVDLVEPGTGGGLRPAAGAEAELAAVLQTTVTRALSPDPRVRLPERRVAANIVGLEGMAADLQASQQHAAGLSAQQSQDFRTVVNQLAAGLAANLRAHVLAEQRALTARADADRQALADLRRQMLTEQRGDSEEDARLADLQREETSVAQAIRAGLGAADGVRLPPLRAVEAAALAALSSDLGDWEAGWQAALDDLAAARSAVDEAAAILDGEATLLTWQQRARTALAHAEAQQRAAERAAAEADAAVAAAEAEVTALSTTFSAAREAWLAAYEALPEAARPATQSVTSSAMLDALRQQCAAWETEQQALQAYLDSYRAFISDWIDRVTSRNAQDEADLRQIYIDNANVIGITCVQAGGRAFSQRYRNFDTVVIDEVSKATPPELLLPMLKGAKIVLVGDSRQLPPMIGSEALQDLAESLGIEARDLAGRQDQSHLERSLFRELFERAPSGLKSWLTDQYRMHPQIMDAINQFYHDKLACRIPEPDVARAHGLAPLIPEATHIAWIPTPWSEPFYETRVGTSRRNDQEVAIIANLVERMDEIWGHRAAGGAPKAVGVITFYAAQESALRSRLLGRGGGQRYANLDVRLGTVDRFQGMEKPVIIVSLVCNNARRDIGFARALERINVAFSRAQELLVIVGSRELFCRRAAAARATERYARVAEVVQRNGGMLNVADFVPR